MMQYVIAHGNSMLPTLPKLSIIKITKQSFYEIGDVISFKGHNGLSYCHRIISMNFCYITTKGDNMNTQNFEIDIPINNVQGLVRLVLKLR